MLAAIGTATWIALAIGAGCGLTAFVLKKMGK